MSANQLRLDFLNDLDNLNSYLTDEYIKFFVQLPEQEMDQMRDAWDYLNESVKKLKTRSIETKVVDAPWLKPLGEILGKAYTGVKKEDYLDRPTVRGVIAAIRQSLVHPSDVLNQK